MTLKYILIEAGELGELVKVESLLPLAIAEKVEKLNQLRIRVRLNF